MKRLHSLDGLRGLLACIVMLVHVVSFIHPSRVLLISELPVAIFFVLSGLVLTRAWDGRFGVFLARRFLRLWPTYAVCLAAGYGLARQQPNWPEFAWVPWPAYDGDTINGPIWSLFIEAWAAFFMPLFVWSSGGGVIRSAVVALAFVVAGKVFPPFLFGTLFVVGAYLSRRDWHYWLFETPVAQWLGRVSYSLYLSHWLVLKAGVGVFGPWGAIAAVPVAFAVAAVLWWGVERPSIAWSRMVGARLAIA